jgi:hypothetical protein
MSFENQYRTRHKRISLIKSLVRIIGLLLLPNSMGLFIIFWIVAEILGIIEEDV